MIIVDKPLNVELSKNLTSSNFRIKASKKAFEILSAGLYSDCTKAIIRELSTNAMDSHVAAGKANEPIEVHLPNKLEPYFSVKDNGVGLSPLQINTIYTTYFESDKTNPNDLTGCLGLGSKSPFSYTDQFTVESRYDGISYTYNAYINAEGLPSISLLGQRSTKECNGVEIKFPVKADDFYEFQRKAAETLRWFSVLPNVNGVHNFSLESRDYMRKTDKYGLLNVSGEVSHVIMGNVAYPVSYHDIRNSNITFTDSERKLLEWGCDLFVPIGSLDITANREKVSYDEACVKLLKDCLFAAAEDIKAEIESDIAKAPTLWEARRALYKAQNSIVGKLKNLMEITWNDQLVKASVDVKHLRSQVHLLAHRKTKYKKSEINNIHADGYPIVVNDLPYGGHARVISWLNQNSNDHCYIFNSVPAAFLVESGIDKVCIYTSSLPQPKRAPRNSISGKRTGVKAKVNEYVSSYSNYNNEFWKPAEVDLSEGGVYVEIAYYRYSLGGQKSIPPRMLMKVVEDLKVLGYNQKIYGIRPNDVKILNKYDGWVSLDDFIKTVIANNKALTEKVKLVDMWNSYNDKNNVSEFLPYLEKLDDNSIFKSFLMKAQQSKLASEDANVKAYIRISNHQSEIDHGEGLLNKLREKVDKKYPLLKYVSYYSDEKQKRKDIIDYIKLIDQ